MLDIFIQIHPSPSGDWGITCSLSDLDPSCGDRFLFSLNGVASKIAMRSADDPSRTEKVYFDSLAQNELYTITAFSQSDGDWVEASSAKTFATNVPPIREFYGPIADPVETRSTFPLKPAGCGIDVTRVSASEG